MTEQVAYKIVNIEKTIGDTIPVVNDVENTDDNTNVQKTSKVKKEDVKKTGKDDKSDVQQKFLTDNSTISLVMTKQEFLNLITHNRPTYQSQSVPRVCRHFKTKSGCMHFNSGNKNCGFVHSYSGTYKKKCKYGKTCNYPKCRFAHF